MKNIIRTFPLHTLLICPAVIFFLYVHNYPDVYLNATYRSLLFSILFSSATLGTSYLVFRRNIHKAGFYSTIFIMLMLSYGVIYDFMERLYYEGKFPFSHIHRYLIGTFFIVLGIFYIITTKKKKTFRSISYPMNIFVLFILLINTVVLLNESTKHTAISEIDPNENSSLAPPAISDTFPDIYYIILDGYAHDSVLSEIYGYKENALTRYLAKSSFYIAAASRTNYISTIPSLSSSLNFDYLDTLVKNNIKGENLVYSNHVSKYFKQKGYKVVHVRSGYAVSRENNYADTIISLENLNEFERTFLRYSILRIDDAIGYANYRTLKEELKVMYGVFATKGPKFVFVHIVSPHPPYICDENGKFKTSSRMRNLWWEPKADYLVQLKYINKETERFISEIFRQSKNHPIIIVQSDHGPWTQAPSFQTIYNTRSKILNAYYIPYQWKSNLYSSITPVNSFRLIFNGLFNDSLPILKDIPLDSTRVRENMNAGLLE